MNKIRVRNLALSLILIALFTLSISCNLQYSEDISSPAGTPVEVDNTTLVGTEGLVPLEESQCPILPSIADVVASVTPTVVTIDTETTYQFFRRTYTQEGAGSGWIIDESGIIVTNNHVIAGADSIIITLYDGRTFFVDPDTIATDPIDDLAVIRIDAVNLPVANIGGSSELRVGDWVVAIGNPLGLGDLPP